MNTDRELRKLKKENKSLLEENNWLKFSEASEKHRVKQLKEALDQAVASLTMILDLKITPEMAKTFERGQGQLFIDTSQIIAKTTIDKIKNDDPMVVFKSAIRS